MVVRHGVPVTQEDAARLINAGFNGMRFNQAL